jgi:hypothetical protein
MKGLSSVLRSLRAHRVAVKTPGSSAKTRAAIRNARIFCDEWKVEIKREIEEILARRKAAIESWGVGDASSAPTAQSAAAYSRGAWAYNCIEGGIAYFLSAQIFRLPSLAAGLIGVGLTAALYFIVRAQLVVQIRDSEAKEQLKFRVLQRLTAASFGVWFVSLMTAITMGRMPLGGDAVKVFYALLLSILTLTSPIAAAALSVAGEVRNAPNTEAMRHAHLTKCLEEIEVLRTECDRAEDDLPRGGTGPVAA